MDLTDSFTWENLPIRDADSGQLTAAGWIPRFIKIGTHTTFVALAVYFVQSTIRIMTNHELTLNAWYPFDWTV
jgi:hypothetical protein